VYRTFRPQKEEAEGVQRKFCHDRFCNLSTPFIILIKAKENKIGRACSANGSTRNV
jgi:hypothetical protein